MRKQKEEVWKRCPKCGKTENQIKAGYNVSGSQRYKCKECGIYYTIDPKRHEYPQETRELAIKMYYGGISGREVEKILNMNKANVMNRIKKDHSDGGEKYPQRCKNCGTRRAVFADLRHYIPTLVRRSRCFPRKPENLQAVLAVFLQAYNRFGLQKDRYRSCHPGVAVLFPFLTFFNCAFGHTYNCQGILQF